MSARLPLLALGLVLLAGCTSAYRSSLTNGTTWDRGPDEPAAHTIVADLRSISEKCGGRIEGDAGSSRLHYKVAFRGNTNDILAEAVVILEDVSPQQVSACVYSEVFDPRGEQIAESHAQAIYDHCKAHYVPAQLRTTSANR